MGGVGSAATSATADCWQPWIGFRSRRSIVAGPRIDTSSISRSRFSFPSERRLREPLSRSFTWTVPFPSIPVPMPITSHPPVIDVEAEDPATWPPKPRKPGGHRADEDRSLWPPKPKRARVVDDVAERVRASTCAASSCGSTVPSVGQNADEAIGVPPSPLDVECCLMCRGCKAGGSCLKWLSSDAPIESQGHRVPHQRGPLDLTSITPGGTGARLDGVSHLWNPIESTSTFQHVRRRLRGKQPTSG